MDKTTWNQNRIKNIAYITTSIIITSLLVIGIILTKDYVFPYHFVAKDIFLLTLPYIVIIFLAVQMFCVTLIGKVREYFISFTTIALSSLISFECTFVIIAFCRNVTQGQVMNCFKSIVFDLCWPAGLVWADYGSDTHWLYPDGFPIIFIFLATAFLTVFEYFWLRKRTEKKKALFVTILITSFVLCTGLSAFMKVVY